MKKIIIIVIILSIIKILFTPDYTELNNIAIIDKVGIFYNNGTYNIYLREIVPSRSNNGIEYNYKYYNSKDKNINKGIKTVEKQIKKKIYLNKIKKVVTNTDIDIIKDNFNIKKSRIYKTNNIKKINLSKD